MIGIGDVLGGVAGLWLLMLSGSLLSGCLGPLYVTTVASPCVNPPEGIGTEDGDNSIVLDVSLYQLRRTPEPSVLEPESLLEVGGVESALGSYLLTPEGEGAELHVQRLEERVVTLKRHPLAEALLVVARGRVLEPGSIRIIPLHPLQTRLTLCVEYTSVFLPGESPGLIAPSDDGQVYSDDSCHFAFTLPPGSEGSPLKGAAFQGGAS